MNSLSSRFAGYAPQILSIVRIVVGLLFLEHGLVKLFGYPPGAQPGVQAVGTLFWVAGVLEAVGGALIVLGLFTRPVAFILSGQMAIGYFMVHAKQSFFPAVNGGDAAILFCFIFLYFAAAGGGAWSFDSLHRRKAEAA